MMLHISEKYHIQTNRTKLNNRYINNNFESRTLSEYSKTTGKALNIPSEY